MKKLINDVIDGQGQSYKLYVELNPSSLPNYYDIRFFSTFTGAKDTTAEQTKWKTTVPTSSIRDLHSFIGEVLNIQ